MVPRARVVRGADANGQQPFRIGGRERVLVRSVVADIDRAVAREPSARLMERDPLVGSAARQQADGVGTSKRPRVGQLGDDPIDRFDRAPLVAALR